VLVAVDGLGVIVDLVAGEVTTVFAASARPARSSTSAASVTCRGWSHLSVGQVGRASGSC
jgi:hypothetical protein